MEQTSRSSEEETLASESQVHYPLLLVGQDRLRLLHGHHWGTRYSFIQVDSSSICSRNTGNVYGCVVFLRFANDWTLPDLNRCVAV